MTIENNSSITGTVTGKESEENVIFEACNTLASITTKGNLGAAIAGIVSTYSPHDLTRMKINFSHKIDSFTPEYKKELKETIASFLDGTYQTIRLMNQQGSFAAMREPVRDNSQKYWMMVARQCSRGDNQGNRLRFLKYLLSGFCMYVREVPGHPVGMPFPGGDKVDYIDGIYYCPVRTKGHDEDTALCPFCPARQTPDIGYLKPPIKGSEHRKQEFIKNTYDYHHFNG